MKGWIVVQDRPRILANAITGEGIEKMDYDFFTEQPVKGTDPNKYVFTECSPLTDTSDARAYYC